MFLDNTFLRNIRHVAQQQRVTTEEFMAIAAAREAGLLPSLVRIYRARLISKADTSTDVTDVTAAIPEGVWVALNAPESHVILASSDDNDQTGWNPDLRNRWVVEVATYHPAQMLKALDALQECQFRLLSLWEETEEVPLPVHLLPEEQEKWKSYGGNIE